VLRIQHTINASHIRCLLLGSTFSYSSRIWTNDPILINLPQLCLNFSAPSPNGWYELLNCSTIFFLGGISQYDDGSVTISYWLSPLEFGPNTYTLLVSDINWNYIYIYIVTYRSTWAGQGASPVQLASTAGAACAPRTSPISTSLKNSAI
jgi:hypothetical protein